MRAALCTLAAFSGMLLAGCLGDAPPASEDEGDEPDDDGPESRVEALRGSVQFADPTVTALGCAEAAGGLISGGSHQVFDHLNWTYAVAQEGFVVEFHLQDGTIREADPERGQVPHNAQDLLICTSDPTKAQTDYLVCLTAPAFPGDRLTACDP